MKISAENRTLFFVAHNPLSFRWKQTQTYTPPFAFQSRVRKCKSYAFGAFLLITLQSSVSRVFVTIFQTFCAKVLNCLPNSHNFNNFLHFSNSSHTGTDYRAGTAVVAGWGFDQVYFLFNDKQNHYRCQLTDYLTMIITVV